MSQSLLYHAFGLRGYDYRAMRFDNGKMVLVIDQRRESYCCSACGSGEVYSQGQMPRRFRALPIGRKPVEIEFAVPRVRCLACGLTRQVKLGFAEGSRRHTKQFERYALELARITTIQAAALHLGVSWDTVCEIEKRYLKKKFSQPKLKYVKRMAIDEIAVRKGHRYLTVVMDLDSGQIIFVGKSRKSRALAPFWKRLKASHAQVEAVAIDMSAAYIEAVTKHLPNAALVFDRFHIVKLFNDKMTELRRELYREATDMLQKDVLKGTRWLLLKNWENLDDKRHERQRLEDALSLNHTLATAYYLKDELRQFWEQSTKKQAERFLDDWCRRARATGIRILMQLANTLQGHRNGILAWYDHRISTGPLEGFNNKIKTLKRMAYGYRNQEYFELKILALHCSQYALVG